jgi:hypothetical protein
MSEQEQIGRITPQWLAGFFDGEGCITAWIDRKDYRKHIFMRVSVELSQKNELLMGAIHSLYPEANLCRCISRFRGKKFTAWKLVWHGKKAIRFLADIIPFLICKKDRAELAYEFCSLIAKHSDWVGKRTTAVHHEVREKRNAIAQEILRINGTYKTFEVDAAGGIN